MSGRAQERGMTLIEVMVATAVWVLLGVLIAGIMYSTVNTQEQVSELQARFHGGRVALDRLAGAHHGLREPAPGRGQAHAHGFKEANRVLFDTAAHEPFCATRTRATSSRSYRVDTVRNDKGARALIRKVKYHIDDRPASGGREELLVEGVAV
jgi:type II secretory pathway pseudopilin PulG